MKRVCGNAVRAVRPANQLAEAAMKVLAYAPAALATPAAGRDVFY